MISLASALHPAAASPQLLKPISYDGLSDGVRRTRDGNVYNTHTGPDIRDRQCSYERVMCQKIE